MSSHLSAALWRPGRLNAITVEQLNGSSRLKGGISRWEATPRGQWRSHWPLHKCARGPGRLSLKRLYDLVEALEDVRRSGSRATTDGGGLRARPILEG